jgi:hypothetical protein
VKPGGVFMGAQQWLLGADVNRNISAAKFDCVERVTRSLLDLDISGDRSDSDHPDVGSAKSHDERNRVVGGDVSVDQEHARHSRRIANEGGRSSVEELPFFAIFAFFAVKNSDRKERKDRKEKQR